jgi:hypothetical protein
VLLLKSWYQSVLDLVHGFGFGFGFDHRNCCSCYNLNFFSFSLHYDLGYPSVLLVFLVVNESVKKRNVNLLVRMCQRFSLVCYSLVEVLPVEAR